MSAARLAMILYNCAPNLSARNGLHFRRAGFLLLAWGLFVGLVCGILPCSADDAKPDVGLPGKWVIPIAFDPRAKTEVIDPSLEMRWLLKDRQINAQIDETFNHEVRQVVTTAGVQNGSHIAIDFNPGFQFLTFHWVRIWRGTNSLNRLDPEKIQVTQAGLDTDQLLFSGDKTALILLEDIRAGDIIDYAYTVAGRQPAFAGTFSDQVEIQSSFPVERSTTRLIWPQIRHLYVQNHWTDIKYAAIRKGDTIEFTWNQRNVAGPRYEPALPAWYDPFPWVQLSETPKWASVDQWALRLFGSSAPLSPELTRQINAWKQLPGKESRVLAALRFVQDEIRYLAIEDGLSGYKPQPPSAVFAQRYGDCKDKSLLFVTMLRAMGIEANVALVNTRLQQTLAQMHPSPAVFDHAIAEVNLDGQIFWLDATANYQRGPLALRSWPNYGWALVIHPGTTDLTQIAPSASLPRTIVNEYLTLGNLNQESQMKIVTIAEGRDAETLRQQFATTARDAIERAHLNYYAKLYPDISQTSEIVYSDDEQQNKVEVDETYSVRNMWAHLPNETFFHAHIYSANVASAMRQPAMSVRTMPLGVAYPQHQIFRAEVVMPSLSSIWPDDQTIENPAFYFHRNVSVANGKLLLLYEYRSLADAVQPDAVPNYIHQLNTASDLTGYTISSN